MGKFLFQRQNVCDFSLTGKIWWDFNLKPHSDVKNVKCLNTFSRVWYFLDILQYTFFFSSIWWEWRKQRVLLWLWGTKYKTNLFLEELLLWIGLNADQWSISDSASFQFFFFQNCNLISLSFYSHSNCWSLFISFQGQVHFWNSISRFLLDC